MTDPETGGCRGGVVRGASTGNWPSGDQLRGCIASGFFGGTPGDETNRNPPGAARDVTRGVAGEASRDRTDPTRTLGTDDRAAGTSRGEETVITVDPACAAPLAVRA